MILPVLQIEQIIISLDILERKFRCGLARCHGNCCVYGDAGAPLEEQEADILEKIYPKLKKFLRPEGISAIEKQGTYVTDDDGEQVTPLIEGKECAYTIVENEIYLCGIEKAFLAKNIKFQKPVSCHLFPVRIKKYAEFSALNYEQWHLCLPAVHLGEKEDLPVYQFAKDALIRKFGKNWYQQLELAAHELDLKPYPSTKNKNK